MQPQALEKIALCKKNRLKYLDLSHLELTEIPLELATCVWIERLSLSHNHIYDISLLASLTQLRKLSLSHNKISDLSPLSSNKKIKDGANLLKI